MALRETETHFRFAGGVSVMYSEFNLKVGPEARTVAHMKRIDLAGQVFGKLTVLGYASTSARGRARWRCRCECGQETEAEGANLRNGNTRSCGCSWRRRGLEHPNSTHAEAGKFTTPEYRAWVNMMTRCYNVKNKSYSDYGGRGVVVCDRWRDSYEAFLSDVGRRPGPRSTLDRIDNEGNYEPGNVRWASYFTQARNRRSTRLSVDDAAAIAGALGAGASQRGLAKQYGVNRGAIQGIWRRIRGTNGPP